MEVQQHTRCCCIFLGIFRLKRLTATALLCNAFLSCLRGFFSVFSRVGGCVLYELIPLIILHPCVEDPKFCFPAHLDFRRRLHLTRAALPLIWHGVLSTKNIELTKSFIRSQFLSVCRRREGTNFGGKAAAHEVLLHIPRSR